jgi:hypothetical protein
LGNHLEAFEELEDITAENRAHPAVLETRRRIHAKAKRWEGALEIVSALVRWAPESPLGWVDRSFSQTRIIQASANLVDWHDIYTNLVSATSFPFGDNEDAWLG